ncbi:hypothetical protein ONE63_007392 [Megalurothrips usitatus]|uniref:Dual specificity protein phosphatase 19 n=1 Tax=Megalurothrips usitatus TaxID=439358 RepID=A0AAV7XR54_9NEOP|nr:hypothetical protein ONE63_007392 [Megalurothrips usitatus]
MSFLSELNMKRGSLNHTSTRVTTVEGKTIVEEMLHGQHLSQELPEKSPGFVVDTKPDLQVAEILPSHLYLGSQDVTQDAELIKKHGITHILSLGVRVPSLPHCPNLSYNFVPALDLPDESIDTILCTTLPLMEEILRKGGCLYVHCNAGVSRSPTVVIAYLIAHRGLSYGEASALVKERRPSTNPNPGFVKQLLAFEDKLKKNGT